MGEIDAEFDTVAHCRDVLALARAAAGVSDSDAAVAQAAANRRFCAGLAGSGLGGLWLARIVSELNDRLVARLIALTAAEHRLPAVPWCWLALGSEGRHEQTFATDQDNGLVFSAADGREAQALRELFLPFAGAVNERLDRCGFAFCGGEIMAGNPKWCLSLDEWRELFLDWVRKPEPKALMHASIFFDFRPLCGDVALAERLRNHQLRLARSSPAFLHLMSENALAAEPPLGFLGEVLTEKVGKRSKGTVDLKKFGARIFVDAARIFALASGTGSVGTARRLVQAGPAAGLLPAEIAAAIAAFSHLLRLRLQNQAQALAAGGLAGHGVDPEGLHELDRAILRESLLQAKRLQQRLKLNYAL